MGESIKRVWLPQGHFGISLTIKKMLKGKFKIIYQIKIKAILKNKVFFNLEIRMILFILFVVFIFLKIWNWAENISKYNNQIWGLL